MRSYGVTNAAPYAAEPAVGAAGDTYFNTTDKKLYLADGTVWMSASGGGMPAGGAANTLLAKNSATDYDAGWTADPQVNSITASPGNVISGNVGLPGQVDMRRQNASGAAVPALQNVGLVRGLGWDGVDTYRVMGTFNFGTAENVSPTASGGYIQYQTTTPGTLTNAVRLRIQETIRSPAPWQIGTSQLTAPNTGTVLDLSNGLLAERRQAITLANGANNNLTLPTSSFVEFTGPSAAFSLTGIAGGVDGAIINFIYVGTQAFTIAHMSASSTAGNLIHCPNLLGEYSVGSCTGTLQYNASSTRWILTSFSPKGSRWAEPWGVLTFNTATTLQSGLGGGSGTIVDVTGMVSTVTYVANRRIKVSFTCEFNSTVATDALTSLLYLDGATVQRAVQYSTQANSGLTAAGFYIWASAAGSHIFRLSGQRWGTGTWQISPSTATPAHLFVEDLGPTAGATPP